MAYLGMNGAIPDINGTNLSSKSSTSKNQSRVGLIKKRSTPIIS